MRRSSKKTQKRIVRFSIVTANIALLLLVVSFVARTQHNDTSPNLSAVANAQSTADPLDQVSSAEIAVHAAKLANLDPEETKAVVADADTAAIMMASTQVDEKVIAKPQVVDTAVKTKADVQKYTTVQGDTLDSLAQKFSVTSDSIRWSNNLTSSRLTPGKELVISPINDGVVYTVKAGDTPDSLAQKFSANKEQIVNFNDAEVAGLTAGDTIVIPGGSVRSAPVARRATTSTAPAVSAFSWKATSVTPTFGGNKYPRGQCTFWAANRRAEIGRPIPNNMGNASGWLRAWKVMGFPYSKTPAYGAVIYFPGNHVGFVERVNDDGSVYISHMNWYGVGDNGQRGGFNRVTYTTIPASQIGSYWFLY